jgi:tRNA(Arg) A34 adenosine deaminase TadA
MTPEQIDRHLHRATEVARRAARMGRHPFGALLVAPDGEAVLAEQGNIDTVHHAEATLARTASLTYPADYLWGCTLVTTFEPCAMCTGTVYWAHIGRIVYGASEADLLALTGSQAGGFAESLRNMADSAGAAQADQHHALPGQRQAAAQERRHLLLDRVACVGSLTAIVEAHQHARDRVVHKGRHRRLVRREVLERVLRQTALSLRADLRQGSELHYKNREQNTEDSPPLHPNRLLLSQLHGIVDSQTFVIVPASVASPALRFTRIRIPQMFRGAMSSPACAVQYSGPPFSQTVLPFAQEKPLKAASTLVLLSGHRAIARH